MDKIKEDQDFVYYRFSEKVWEKEEDYVLNEKVGVCQFNKNTEEFKLDEEKTDQYFLGLGKSAVVKVKFKLVAIGRGGGDFPNIIDIATG